LTKIVSLDQILEALPDIDVIGEIERGFVALSEGKVDVPPVGELLFPDEHGELHIKYGAIRGDDVFVVKLATGFFNNPK
jgi:ornithine cyclodeaminase